MLTVLDGWIGDGIKDTSLRIRLSYILHPHDLFNMDTETEVVT